VRQENQCWPIDVPRAEEATLGGVVATNFNGPRRYGCGTVRDHVIGIHAVNSLGEPFKGGGRVVKNVAGYDFCKLLTGSLGTLGILTQFTLRLVPLPPTRRIIACQPRDWEHAEQLLESLVHMKSNPAAIELLAGPGWSTRSELEHDGSSPTLAVVWEGTSDEVDWLTAACQQRWLQQDMRRVRNLDEEPTERCWRELVEFPARGKSPLVLKATMLPSVVTRFMQQVQQLDPQCSQQAHAGNGIVFLRFSSVPDEGIARTLFGRLRPATQGGQVIVLANPGGDEMTPACVWGGTDSSHQLMTAVQREFDPLGLLNPGRFVYR
jgi:glycolate oxidase FAD binding subunit